MVNKIWTFFVLAGAFFYLISGNVSGLQNQLLKGGIDGLKLIWEMMPLLVLWSGIMKVAEESHLLDKFALLLRPLLTRLFPSLEENHPALGYISSNIAANALGLGSAATPFGLKAMKALQSDNPNKSVATEAMVTFLVLNTGGVTLIPSTVLAIRVSLGSVNPSCIIIPSILATLSSNIAGLLFDYYKRKNSRYE